MTGDIQMKVNMDRMYRRTRFIYDASRKYYLLGRDRLISSLNPSDDESVCEVGCGTARNLIKLAARYPKTTFAGLDISDEMLKTARRSLAKKKMENRIQLAQGYAQNFDPQSTFQLDKPLRKIVFSYALSIIPPWKESLDHALAILPPGGEIHIIDFGPQDGLPALFRKFLFWWLQLFHVYYKPEVEDYLKELERRGEGLVMIQPYYGGYCYRAVFKKA